MLGVAAGLVLAWNITGQISGSNASNDFSQKTLDNFPAPSNWLDRATGGQGALYLGQGIDQGEAFGLSVMEFWNRSLKQVWSLDGTAPGPGPTLTPNLAEPTAGSAPDPGLDYVVAGQGIDLVGTVVRTAPPWRVYRIQHSTPDRPDTIGLSPDGWSGANASYNRTRPRQPGGLRTRLGRPGRGEGNPRQAGDGDDPRRAARDRKGQAAASGPRDGNALLRRGSGKQRTFVIPTPRPPIRVEVPRVAALLAQGLRALRLTPARRAARVQLLDAATR